MNRSSIVGCMFLLSLLIVGALIGPSVVAMVISPVVAALLAAELDRRGPLAATQIVRLAGRIIPASHREDYVDEWVDHVRCSGDAGIAPIFTAVDIALRAAPRVALLIRLRYVYGTILITYSVQSVVAVRGFIMVKTVAAEFESLHLAARSQPPVRPLRIPLVRYRMAKRAAVLLMLHALPLQVVLLRRTLKHKGSPVLSTELQLACGFSFVAIVWFLPFLIFPVEIAACYSGVQYALFFVYATVTRRTADRVGEVFRRGGQLIVGRPY